MRRINLWLDDLRQPPAHWKWAKDIEKAKQYFTSPQHEVMIMSLDHDLGDDVPTGYDLVSWMADNDKWPTEAIYLHTSNPAGRKRMENVINIHSPYLLFGNICKLKKDCDHILW
jgi:hypothetical protein